MMKRKAWIAAVLLAAFGLGVSACGGGNNNGADTKEPDHTAPGGAVTAQADEIYQANCMSCHGTDLGGGFGPELKNVGERLNADQMFTVIKEGRGQMPAFGGSLSDEEIRALVAWINEQ